SPSRARRPPRRSSRQWRSSAANGQLVVCATLFRGSMVRLSHSCGRDRRSAESASRVRAALTPALSHRDRRGGSQAHLALFGASFIWGLSYLGTKIALDGMGPFQMAALRVLIAAAFYVPIFVASRRSLSARQGVALGLLGVV